MQGDRRTNKIRFDRTINLSAVIGFLILLGTVVNFGTKLLANSRNTNQKITIMWQYLERQYPELKYMGLDDK